MTLRHARRSANRALWIVLTAGIIGWVLFVAAGFTDILVESGRTTEELWGADAVAFVRPSTYLLFGAVAVFTFGGLIGRRLSVRPHDGHASRLSRPVRLFATTVTIIGLVLAAWGAVIVFLSNFYESTDEASVVTRILNSYLPIVLYTALVIAVILSAFVFVRPASPWAADIDAAEDDALVGANTGLPDADADGSAAASRRNIALAFTVPIVAVAVALIFGLIVYDLTQTALETWVWVIVQTLIAGGIVVGTLCTARAISAQARIGSPGQFGVVPTGLVAGAKNLNLVLSIIFAAAVTIMALGYGASAVQQLRYQPSLWLSAYSETGMEQNEVPLDRVSVSANGSGLLRGSEITLSLEPGGEILASAEVGRDGSAWVETGLDANIAPGDYRLSVQALTVEETERSEEFSITVTEDDTVQLPESPSVGSDDGVSRVVAPSASWAFGDLLPAGVLLLLVVATLHLTLHLRNRDE